MYRKGNPCLSLVENKLVENSMEVPQNIKTRTTTCSCDPTTNYVSKGNEISILKRFHVHVYSGTIHNNQDKESI
jgi:hypothetical protein